MQAYKDIKSPPQLKFDCRPLVESSLFALPNPATFSSAITFWNISIISSARQIFFAIKKPIKGTASPSCLSGQRGCQHIFVCTCLAPCQMPGEREGPIEFQFLALFSSFSFLLACFSIKVHQ